MAGAPVLLLHGLSQQRRFWDPVSRRLRSAPVAAVDLRGHGDTGTPPDADFSVRACADDVPDQLDALGWERAVLVGHSWGAWVALAAAARHPERVVSIALIDGGLWSLGTLGPRDEVRTALTPPSLGIPEQELWQQVRAGDLGPAWSDEVEAALRPTFVVGDDGLVRTRLGLERHMRVLDGLLDHEPESDLEVTGDAGIPVWAAVCEPVDRPLASSAALPHVRIHRWAGAVHDVPLQWPALVAGFVDALVESGEGGSR
jgi:pimeloyl-ACP methyl ester carboxylesterase